MFALALSVKDVAVAQSIYPEAAVSRFASLLDPANEMTALESLRDNPWLAFMEQVSALDYDIDGYLFQEYDEWHDWETFIVRLRNERPEKPMGLPEEMVRRIARIWSRNSFWMFPFVLRFGFGVHESLEDTIRLRPMVFWLAVMIYIGIFYELP